MSIDSFFFVEKIEKFMRLSLNKIIFIHHFNEPLLIELLLIIWISFAQIFYLQLLEKLEIHACTKFIDFLLQKWANGLFMQAKPLKITVLHKPITVIVPFTCAESSIYYVKFALCIVLKIKHYHALCGQVFTHLSFLLSFIHQKLYII